MAEPEMDKEYIKEFCKMIYSVIMHLQTVSQLIFLCGSRRL